MGSMKLLHLFLYTFTYSHVIMLMLYIAWSLGGRTMNVNDCLKNANHT